MRILIAHQLLGAGLVLLTAPGQYELDVSRGRRHWHTRLAVPGPPD